MTKQTDKPYCFCEVTKDTCENCFTVIDIETTGFGDRAGIVELAAVKFKDGKVFDTFNSLINPQIPICICIFTILLDVCIIFKE